MGASALVIAAAFAVAFAVLVSSTSTQTAEAATIDLPAADRAVTAAPGDTVTIVVADAFARVSITDTADGVGASFAASGGQSIACSDDEACDIDDSDANTPGNQNVSGSVTVALNIDADSGTGHILLSVSGIGSTNTDLTKVITVSKAGQIGSLGIKADAATDRTIAATGGISNLTVEVKNASTPAGPLAGQAVTVTTSHGTVGCSDTAGNAAAGTTQTCTATTAAAGIVDVLLTGGGVEGQATVTATLGTRTATASVTLFGNPKNLTAEPMQSSVEIGGSVFIVLTVTDGAGNPISGRQITPVTSKEVVGPEGDDTVPVATTRDTAAGTAGSTTVPAGVGYSKDYVAAKAADNIPACGDDNAHIGTDDATYDELFGSDDAAGTATEGEGTNAAGKCVVEVTAPAATATAKAATRGVHTLNFQISAAVKASAMIEVAGSPASISTDAPAMVDAASVTEITVSVFDDEDVLVGITDVRVRKVDGGGLVEDAGDGGVEKTSNGQSKFSFIAPSSAGTAEILITAGKAPPHRVSIQIGEEEAAPEPEAPSLSLTKTLSGTTTAVFSGGSVDELGSALAAECGAGARAWVVDYQGDWVSYRADAPPILNRAFNAHYPDGIAGPTAMVVTDCE